MSATRNVWLGLHTTEVTGAVAVIRDGQVHSRALQPGGQHAASLLGVVSGELAALGTDAAHLQGIAVTLGPGSFTGIRIGLATAQGLALAADLPVAVCDSLEAEARARGVAGWSAVVLDARRGEVYAALYRSAARKQTVVLPPFVGAPGPVAERLLQAAPEAEPVSLTGSGAHLVLAATSDARLQAIERVPAEQVARSLVDAAAAGRLPVRAPRELQPLYLRKSDAELNRQAGFGAR